jgi:hypothetical protein
MLIRPVPAGPGDHQAKDATWGAEPARDNKTTSAVSPFYVEESADYYDRAVNIVLCDRNVSVGYKQCRFARRADGEEGRGKPPNHSGKPEILIGNRVDRGALEHLGEE